MRLEDWRQEEWDIMVTMGIGVTAQLMAVTFEGNGDKQLKEHLGGRIFTSNQTEEGRRNSVK